MKYLGVIVILIIGLYFRLQSEPEKEVKKNEKYYQTIICNDLDGKMEYVLPDKTRVDCLTDEYAIEVDWARKWAEGVGQSLYYAHMTDKKPSIGLIVGNKDQKYLKRLKKISDDLGIKVIVLDKTK